MRFGFEEVGCYTLAAEDDEPGSAPYTEWYAMWRPPVARCWLDKGGGGPTRPTRDPL